MVAYYVQHTYRPMVTPSQMKTIYRLEKKLGLRNTWNWQLSREQAVKRINRLTGLVRKQQALF